MRDQFFVSFLSKSIWQSYSQHLRPVPILWQNHFVAQSNYFSSRLSTASWKMKWLLAMGRGWYEQDCILCRNSEDGGLRRGLADISQMHTDTISDPNRIIRFRIWDSWFFGFRFWVSFSFCVRVEFWVRVHSTLSLKFSALISEKSWTRTLTMTNNNSITVV